MGASQIIRVELILITILVINILNESILFDLVNKGIINFIILTSIIIIYSMSKLTKDLYLFLPLFFILLFSVFVNANQTEAGGLNTFVLFITSLPFLFIKSRKIDFYYMYRCLFTICLFFLVLIYYYYLFGLQETPEHLSFILSGPYINQNTLAMILFSLISLLMFFYPKINKGLFKSKSFILLIFFLYLSVLLTQSRSAILLSTILLLYCYRKYLIYITPVSVLLLWLMPVSLIDRSFVERASSKISEAGSSGRVDFWYKTFSDLTTNVVSFLFGIGVNNVTIKVDDISFSVHSSYVNFIANYGFLASIFMSFILIYIMYNSYKLSRLLFLIIFSILLYGAFETTLFSGYSILWLSMLFIYYSRTCLRDHDAYFNHSVRTSSH